MNVALVTEGTYPYHFGGVSVWCDQLIRAMPDHTFTVVALVGTGAEQAVWALPANVHAVDPVPMWGPPIGPRTGRRARPAFLTILRQFLEVLLDPAATDPGRFGEVLRALGEYGRRESLTDSFVTQGAVRLLSDAWHGYGSGPAGPTLHDALTALELLEHALRPLCREPVRADVVHTSTSGLGALPALAATWHYGTPMVVSDHGVYLREQYLHSRGGPYRWPVRALYLSFLRQLCALAYREAATVTSCNLYNQRWQEQLGAPTAALRTVYNGVNVAEFPALSAEPDVPTIVWVGRIDPIKDIETLLRSFAQVRHELPEARLRMYGPTPSGMEGYLRRCQKLATELGIADAATFEGRADDLRGAYESGHVVVLCSVSEGLPFTVIEAMTFARPCVATDVGGVTEALGDTGIAVPPRQPQALARACLALLRDTALRRRLGAAGRERALAHFTVDRAITAFTEIYRTVDTTRWP